MEEKDSHRGAGVMGRAQSHGTPHSSFNHNMLGLKGDKEMTKSKYHPSVVAHRSEASSPRGKGGTEVSHE